MGKCGILPAIPLKPLRYPFFKNERLAEQGNPQEPASAPADSAARF